MTQLTAGEISTDPKLPSSDLFSSGKCCNIHVTPAAETDVSPPCRTAPSTHTHIQTGTQTHRYTQNNTETQLQQEKTLSTYIQGAAEKNRTEFYP